MKKAPAVSAERTALALAQAAAEDARKVHDEAKLAASTAFDKLIGCQDAIELLSRPLSEAELEHEAAEYRRGVVSSIAGDALDVLEIEPKAKRAAALREAQAEHSKWRTARANADAEVSARADVLRSRLAAVDRAASAVIAASVDIEALIREAQALESQYVTCRTRLAFFAQHVAADQRRAIDAFRGRPLYQLDSVDGWRSAEAVGSWRLAHEALKTDATAALPE